MSKFRDLTGMRFGYLTVTKRAEDYIEPSSGRHRAKWLCNCDCGNETIVLDSNLTKKNGIKSCGCLRRNFAYNLNKKCNTYDLTGEYGIGYTSKGEEFYFDRESFFLGERGTLLELLSIRERHEPNVSIDTTPEKLERVVHDQKLNEEETALLYQLFDQTS